MSFKNSGRSGKSERAKNSDGKIVDLRKKENKELRKKQPPTIHMQMKNRFSTNDYFTNSACRTADAAIKSQEELSNLYIDNKKDKHDAVKKKRDRYKKWLDELKTLKATMIERSKACKEGRKAPDPKLSSHYIWYDKKHDIFCLCSSETDPNNKGRVFGHGRMTICLSSSILILRLKRLNRLSILFRKNMSGSALK